MADVTSGRLTFTEVCRRRRFGLPVTRPTPLTLMPLLDGEAVEADGDGLAGGDADAEWAERPRVKAPMTTTAAAAPTANGRNAALIGMAGPPANDMNDGRR